MIGLPFALEAFAFFIEAIFVGIYLYGWDRLSPWAHWWSGWPVAIGGLASAWFVVTANAWMQSPVGFELSADGHVIDVQPIRAMLNPSTPVMTTHMILAAYMATGLTVASIYAVGMLKGRRDTYHRRGLALGLVLGLVIAPFQVVVGDAAARLVAERQPAKLAAIEALWHTTAGAPLTIGGIPLMSREATILGIRIPDGLSWLAHGDPHAVITGLDAVPREDWPNVTVVHIAFQVMVGIGFAMAGLGLWALVGWLRRRRRALPEGSWFLRAVAVAGVATFVALESGWVVTELGRQPWIVQGQMRTAEAVTPRGGIGWWLFATVAVYVLLGGACAWLLRQLARASSMDARANGGVGMSRTGLEATILIAIGAGLALYVLLGGADFGGGVWDLAARGPRHDREHALISSAIGPVWEANHVWLIFVVTALFAAFPPAFAALGVALYVPLGIAIAGIVMRGAAFAFRAHGDPGTAWQRTWTRVFGIASIVTPFVFGMCAAAIASGRIRVDQGAVQTGLVRVFTGPLAWVSGALLLTMCAYLAATYLTVESVQRGDRELEDVFRRRAIGTALVAGVLAVLGLFTVHADAKILWNGMAGRGWPFVLLSAAAGVVSLASMTGRRYRRARIAAAVAVASVIAGWGVAQWPYLIVPDVTISDASAPVSSLRAIAIGYAVGTLLLMPSLLLLFRVFKSTREEPVERIAKS